MFQGSTTEVPPVTATVASEVQLDSGSASIQDSGPPNDLDPDLRPYGRGRGRNGFEWMLELAAVLARAGIAL